MLMTVLKGDLAVRQSKALIRTFKEMKDFISENRSLVGGRELLQLSLQTTKNTEDIAVIKQYPNTNITFTKTCGILHDRYIVIDYKTPTEKIYHCGASSKDAGSQGYVHNSDCRNERLSSNNRLANAKSSVGIELKARRTRESVRLAFSVFLLVHLLPNFLVYRPSEI